MSADGRDLDRRRRLSRIRLAKVAHDLQGKEVAVLVDGRQAGRAATAEQEERGAGRHTHESLKARVWAETLAGAHVAQRPNLLPGLESVSCA
jgi:hypothetical protein